MPKAQDNSEEYMRVQDGYLEIRVKLGPGTPSTSGKSLVVASTGGFALVGDGVKVNLTAIKPR